MTYKWIGAVLVILGCGGWGYAMGAQQRHQEKLLTQLERLLEFMEWELQYRLTPLPELCRKTARESGGTLGQVFRDLGDQLDRCRFPEVHGCMKEVLMEHRELPGGLRRLLTQLGRNLGRFDLPGQLQGLNAVRAECAREGQRLSESREFRKRNCRTLGLCAGAALVILFV